MQHHELHHFLEHQYAKFHRPEYLCMDPLTCLQGFSEERDLEIAGLTAAALAYGRVETIIKNVSDIFSRTGTSIADFAVHTTLERKLRVLGGFKHRFNTGSDIACLLHALGKACTTHGSLEALFTKGLSPAHTTIKDGLTQFVKTIRAAFPARAASRQKAMDYLLPSPQSGSACKRLNMYLRWMVRPEDGIDCGIWKTVPPSLLVIPVDTHVARIAASLGLTARKCADWRMAEEITALLRTCDPRDPVRFDFSLCRSGMTAFRKKAA